MLGRLKALLPTAPASARLCRRFVAQWCACHRRENPVDELILAKSTGNSGRRRIEKANWIFSWLLVFKLLMRWLAPVLFVLALRGFFVNDSFLDVGLDIAKHFFVPLD